MTGTSSDSNAPYMDAMHRLLLSVGPASEQIALPRHLDRSQLNFSLDSLREVDRYLNFVHEGEPEGEGQSLLTTLWAMALYVGEIIRRESPAGRYQWITIGDEPLASVSASVSASAGTSSSPANIGVVRALRACNGDICLPSRAVLRVVLRGLKVRSIDSFACGAIGLTDDGEEPASARRRIGVAAAVSNLSA